MGCLANKSFTDTSNTPPAKLGRQASAGIQLLAGSPDCRLVWDEQEHSIRLYTADGAVQGIDGLPIEQIIDKTNQDELGDGHKKDLVALRRPKVTLVRQGLEGSHGGQDL